MRNKAMKNFFSEFIKKHCQLNRTAVNPDTDILISNIQDLLKCDVIEIPSGTECLTWIIPKSWKVREASLSRTDGTVLIDFKENPLHLWTHSVSFQGKISREALEKHLHYDEEHPEWIPYHYRNGYRFDAEDWGFCLSYNDYIRLTDDSYLVNIDADLNLDGSMKVIDFFVPGKNPQTIFFGAHTCHPGIATDGLSNIALLIEFFSYLKNIGKRYYSYRLILGPEYFGAAGFLASKIREEIERLKGGIYFDMIGNGRHFVYQSSFQGDSILDAVVKNVFEHHVPDHGKAGFRGVWGNDEAFYNGPGFMIPTISIVCDRHPEYHFNADNYEFVDLGQLEAALEIVRNIVDVFESDYVPVPLFRGPIYLSRYNLYIDPKLDRKGYDNIQNIQMLMDGKRSCFQIASLLGADFFFVKKFCDGLESNDLIKITPNTLLFND